MAPEFGFCLRPDLRRDDCSGPLHLWIGHRSATRFVPTVHDIRHDEWDAVAGSIVVADGDNRAGRLDEYAQIMARDLQKVEEIVGELERSGKRYTAGDVTDEFEKARSGAI